MALRGFGIGIHQEADWAVLLPRQREVARIVELAIVPAGRAVVLAYTMPLRAIPIGLFLGREPLGRNQLAGAAVGYAGLILFMNPGLVSWRNGQVLAGNTLLLLAAFAWALGSCLYRRRLWISSFWVQTLWQLAVSIIPVGGTVLIGAIVPVGPVGGGPVHWSPALIAILAYNCIVTTAVGYFLWGKVLAMMPAATAGQVLTLTPIGGFVLSTLMFGGTITADAVVSIVFIVGGNLHHPVTVMRWFYCRPQNRIGQEELHRHSPRLAKSWRHSGSAYSQIDR